MDGRTLNTTGDILQEARSFYVNLFHPDSVDHDAINTLLDAIPPECHVSKEKAERMSDPVTKEEMLALLKHSPKCKSPGLRRNPV